MTSLSPIPVCPPPHKTVRQNQGWHSLATLLSRHCKPGWTNFCFRTAPVLSYVHIDTIASHSCCRFVCCTSRRDSPVSPQVFYWVENWWLLSTINSVLRSRDKLETIPALWRCVILLEVAIGGLSTVFLMGWTQSETILWRGLALKRCSVGNKVAKVWQESRD